MTCASPPVFDPVPVAELAKHDQVPDCLDSADCASSMRAAVAAERRTVMCLGLWRGPL